MSPKPTIVLVLGSWHEPSCFSRIQRPLENLGYTCYTPAVPSNGALAATKTVRDDADVIRKVIQSCVDAGEEVLVVAHSSGGFRACMAVEGLLASDLSGEGKKRGVIGLAMIAAFIPSPPGSGLGDIEKIAIMDHSWFEIDPVTSTCKPINAQYRFYNDLSPSEADYWASRLGPTNMTRIHEFYDAWRRVPTFYLVCENDMAQPVSRQEGMIEAARAEGADISVKRLDCGHSPFLSRPDEVVEWLREVCERCSGSRGSANLV